MCLASQTKFTDFGEKITLRRQWRRLQRLGSIYRLLEAFCVQNLSCAHMHAEDVPSVCFVGLVFHWCGFSWGWCSAGGVAQHLHWRFPSRCSRCAQDLQPRPCVCVSRRHCMIVHTVVHAFLRVPTSGIVNIASRSFCQQHPCQRARFAEAIGSIKHITCG